MTHVKKLIWLLLAFSVLTSTGAGGSFISGSLSCPSSGNKAVMSASTKASWYSLQAPITNTGIVSVGGSNVTNSNGQQVYAGGSFSGPTQGNSQPHDLSQVYIACTVSGDSMNYVYGQ